MNIGANGLALIKSFENLRLVAFKPIPSDPWTIGWGRAHGVSEGDTCTREQADAWLLEDVTEAERAVSKYCTQPLNQNQFDALVSFTYNVGGGGFASSTMLRHLNDGDYQAAAAQFKLWNKAGGATLAGLTRRRESERRLFCTMLGEEFVP